MYVHSAFFCSLVVLPGPVLFRVSSFFPRACDGEGGVGLGANDSEMMVVMMQVDVQ